jgi:hypothetical protein
VSLSCPGVSRRSLMPAEGRQRATEREPVVRRSVWRRIRRHVRHHESSGLVGPPASVTRSISRRPWARVQSRQ